MSLKIDWQQFKETGLDKAKKFANEYVDIQLENALQKERLEMVDQDSGHYQISDDERENMLTNLQFGAGGTIAGIPTTYALMGAAALGLFVMMRGAK